MRSVSTDYYALLQVERTCTSEELKKAYRRRARELHPDANPDDPTAEARFKEVAVAYEVLSDPDKRARYDRYGEDGLGGAMAGDPFGFGGGLGDIFSQIFGGGMGGPSGPTGPPPGADVEVTARIEFVDAVFGAAVPVEVHTAVACTDCEATGAAAGTSASPCPDCGGSGQVRRVRQSLLGQMVTAGICGRCGGWGRIVEHPCPTCNGEGRNVVDKTYTVDVPAGVHSGSTLRLTGLGAVGPRGGAHGDLYVHLAVAPHEVFTRDGDDLLLTLPIGFAQAALGANIEVETLDDVETVRIDKGTQPGTVTRLRGLGVPRLGGRGRGDLLITVTVEVPTDLGDDEAELVRKLAEMRGEELHEQGEGLLSRVRSAFKG
ncbi:MAG: molecular chaperone DnaJ [Actinobacteria bacterium]|nr:molecular chaperone DnaJ [Actinomycetota bacterium]